MKSLNSSQFKHVVILGGGTAGWLTAGMLAATYRSTQARGLNISLIESPDVATIGVGEGAWPSMRHTLQQIGISETDFIRHCHVSLKQGSQFIGWNHHQTKDRYYHPFTAPSAANPLNLNHVWQALVSDQPFSHVMGTQAQVCEMGLAPKQLGTPEYAGVLNYGYHLDAGKFAELLKTHCTEKLGVKHISYHVTSVENDGQGDIQSLNCQNQGAINGDLFIDCSGMQSMLLGKHYQVPLTEQKRVLFNDSALATQVAYANDISPVQSTTLAVAQDSGWIWDIGLSNRRGVGYTYSSAHTTDEQARQQLEAYIGDGKTLLDIRKLSFTPGYRQKFWHKNCVAIGMSSGFIEPLEASALAMVELSCNMLCEEFPVNREHMQGLAERFNQRFSYRWQRVIEFLKLHYVLSDRSDSPYWRDHRRPESIPQRLQDLLELWRYQAPSRLDFIQNEEVFPSASYQYILYGMGFYTRQRPFDSAADDLTLAQQYLQGNQQQLQQLQAGLPTNRDLLTGIHQHGLKEATA